MKHIYKKRLYKKRLKRKVDLNNGFYKGYFSKDGKGLYKVNNKLIEKKIYTKLMNKRFRHRKIDLEETGYKSTQYKKGLYDIQWIIW